MGFEKMTKYETVCDKCNAEKDFDATNTKDFKVALKDESWHMTVNGAIYCDECYTPPQKREPGEKQVFHCPTCGKEYQSRAGRNRHRDKCEGPEAEAKEGEADEPAEEPKVVEATA